MNQLTTRPEYTTIGKQLEALSPQFEEIMGATGVPAAPIKLGQQQPPPHPQSSQHAAFPIGIRVPPGQRVQVQPDSVEQSVAPSHCSSIGSSTVRSSAMASRFSE